MTKTGIMIVLCVFGLVIGLGIGYGVLKKGEQELVKEVIAQQSDQQENAEEIEKFQK